MDGDTRTIALFEIARAEFMAADLPDRLTELRQRLLGDERDSIAHVATYEEACAVLNGQSSDAAARASFDAKYPRSIAPRRPLEITHNLTRTESGQ